MACERSPAPADVEDVRARRQPARAHDVVKLVLSRVFQRLLVGLEERLGVEFQAPVQEGEIEVVAVIVVLRYPVLVTAHVPEKEGPQEPPERMQGVPVGRDFSKIEGGEKVALEVYVSVHIGFADGGLVERFQRAQRLPCAEAQSERCRTAAADAMDDA